MSNPRPAPGPGGRVAGTLSLGVELRDGRSLVARQRHQGPLRVLRPYHADPWQVSHTVVNVGGGYLGGDVYTLEVDVADGAALLLGSQSATKVYRTPLEPARQDATFHVGAGALLEYLPDQLVLYRDARYEQVTRVVADADATVVLSDVVTPGWSPEGEPFRWDRARLRTRVERPDGRLVLLDNLVLDPSRTAMDEMGMLDGWSHAGSLLVVDRRVDGEVVARVSTVLDGFSDRVRVGCTVAPGPTLAVRLLGNRTEHVQAAVTAVVDLLRAEWFSLPPLDPRKY